MDRDPEMQQVVDAAGRWAAARSDAEVAAVLAATRVWAQRRRARAAALFDDDATAQVLDDRRQEAVVLDALTADAAGRHVWYPAYTWPDDTSSSSLVAATRRGRTRCQCQAGACLCEWDTP
jgi:hypothetical protein